MCLAKNLFLWTLVLCVALVANRKPTFEWIEVYSYGKTDEKIGSTPCPGCFPLVEKPNETENDPQCEKAEVETCVLNELVGTHALYDHILGQYYKGVIKRWYAYDKESLAGTDTYEKNIPIRSNGTFLWGPPRMFSYNNSYENDSLSIAIPFYTKCCACGIRKNSITYVRRMDNRKCISICDFLFTVATVKDNQYPMHENVTNGPYYGYLTKVEREAICNLCDQQGKCDGPRKKLCHPESDIYNNVTKEYVQGNNITMNCFPHFTDCPSPICDRK